MTKQLNNIIITRNAALDEAQAGIKIAGRNIHKLESRLPGEISTTSDMQMTPPLLMAESEEELKSLWMKVKEESEKVGLTFRKQRSWHLVPSLHGK